MTVDRPRQVRYCAKRFPGLWEWPVECWVRHSRLLRLRLGLEGSRQESSSGSGPGRPSCLLEHPVPGQLRPSSELQSIAAQAASAQQLDDVGLRRRGWRTARTSSVAAVLERPSAATLHKAPTAPLPLSPEVGAPAKL
eukprot:scaffold3100_cov403-Prasinococcus_capsulatus_cf.AAC.4